MFYARIVVLYSLLSICSTNESKIKHASKPVRLFTEEELQRYDGSEVGYVLCHKNTVLVLHDIPFKLKMQTAFTKDL